MSVKRKKTTESSSVESDSKRVFWNQGLKVAMEDPDQIVESDDCIIILKDKYPKAKYHFLVLPKTSINNLKALTKDHLDLLKHMHQKGVEIAKKTDPKVRFRFGYHAVPSMSHLHLHVISQDFSGSGLKHKKHWNSFNTAFFINSLDIIKELEDKGKVHAHHSKQAEDLLKTPLRCHECKAELANMPKLKAHIATHYS